LKKPLAEAILLSFFACLPVRSRHVDHALLNVHDNWVACQEDIVKAQRRHIIRKREKKSEKGFPEEEEESSFRS
jgi:hypothetical protein